ncbi:MAG: glycoside hydrolase family 28 protein [Bacteroidales bacterium]|nr:glycoside hydrolase family 28 protein [Bacteroidales bacterium]
MKHVRNLLITTAILAAVCLTGCKPAPEPAATAPQYVTVEAPESPYAFAPLQMFVFPDRDFPITKYGARPGDIAANSAALAKAMAACNAAGGGRVVVPAGEWITGPIHFKSNCNLYLSEDAVIVFEDSLELYYPAVQVSWEGAECMNISPLLYAFECENIAISGPGRLAPKMDFWRTWFDRPESHIQATRQLYAMCSTGVPAIHRHMEEPGVRMRPHLIHFNRCTNVQLDGFQIRESPFWTIHLFMCKDVWAHDLDVYAHGHNNDGIDLEMTQHAIVERCKFDQGDDAVVLKAGRNQDGWRLAMPTQDLVIRNCEIIQGHCLLGIGSEMSGGIRNVYMHDCHSSDQVYRLFYIKTNHRRGGVIEHITVENVSATKMLRVFEIDTDVMYQWRDIVPTFETAITKISDICIRHAEAEQSEAIYELSGDEREPIRDIRIEDVHVGLLTQFESRTSFVEGLTVRNVVYDKMDAADGNMSISGIAPGR